MPVHKKYFVLEHFGIERFKYFDVVSREIEKKGIIIKLKTTLVTDCDLQLTIDTYLIIVNRHWKKKDERHPDDHTSLCRSLEASIYLTRTVSQPLKNPLKYIWRENRNAPTNLQKAGVGGGGGRVG